MKEQKKINVIETLENCKSFIESQKQIFKQKEVVDSIDNHIEALDRAIALIKSYEEFLKQIDKSNLQENKELSIFSSDSNLELKGKWHLF